MLVNESKFFKSGANTRLKVCLWNEIDIIIDCTLELTVDKLKAELLLQHFAAISTSPQDQPASTSSITPSLAALTLESQPQLDETIAKETVYHKIIHVRSGVQLKDDDSLKNQGVKENDELLLLVKRVAAPINLFNQKKTVAPSVEEITAATESVATLESEKTAAKPAASNEFLLELRKILLTLIEAAYKVLCLDLKAVHAINKSLRHTDIVEETMEATTRLHEEERTIKQLTDMGFTRSQALRALKRNKMSVESSIQWLLEGEPELDEPPAEEDNPSPSSPSALTPPALTPPSDNLSCPSPSPSHSGSSDTRPEAIKFLEEFHKRQEARFKPSPKAISNLMDMGFEHSHVVSALRATNNREADACEYLLSGKEDVLPDDMNDSLDTDSPLYKAIMSSPVVQLGLCNPRNLQAFLQILDNPNSIGQWLNDPDTGPILLQISRIYHIEKNATMNITTASEDTPIVVDVVEDTEDTSDDVGAVGGASQV